MHGVLNIDFGNIENHMVGDKLPAKTFYTDS